MFDVLLFHIKSQGIPLKIKRTQVSGVPSFHSLNIKWPSTQLDLQYRLYHSVAYAIGCAFYLFGRRIILWKLAQFQSNVSTEYSGLQLQVYWISRATFSKNNFSKTVGTGISATSTTQSSSPQHPMRKIGNRRHEPSLLNPHSPLRLDLLKPLNNKKCFKKNKILMRTR